MDDVRAIDILSILQERLIMLTGGRDRKGRLIIHIPATSKRERFKIDDFRKLLHYFINITSDEIKEIGFTIVIDARGNGNISGNTKPLLKMFQEHFSLNIHQVAVIKADNFWQKQKASLSVNKFKFEVHNCCVESLLKIIDGANLTPDVSGSLNFDYNNWIELRLKIEEFLWQVSTYKHISNMKYFTF